MRFTWFQHQEAARTIGRTAIQNSGTALALMGVALLILIQDLEEGC